MSVPSNVADRLQKLLYGMRREKEQNPMSAGAGITLALILVLRLFS